MLQVQNFHLVEWQWLKENYNYGTDVSTERFLLLQVSNLQTLVPVQEQEQNGVLLHLLHLLHWFIDKFPCYYDQCEHCGASYREDCLATRDAASNDEDDKKYDYNDDGNIDGDNDNDSTKRQNYNSASNGVEVLSGPGGVTRRIVPWILLFRMDELEGKADRN